MIRYSLLFFLSVFILGGCSSVGVDDASNGFSSNWITVTVDDAGGDVGIDPCLALDSNDIPHITYYDQAARDLKYARKNGSTWEVERVDSVGDVGEEAGIAIDTSGNPHISYLDVTNTAVKYCVKNGTSWEIETFYNEDNQREVSTSIALFNDLPRIAFNIELIEETPDVESGAIKYAVYNGSSWEVSTVCSGGTDVYLALDSSGKAHIAFKKDVEDVGKIHYATNSSGSFEVEVLDVSTLCGGDTGIAVDANARPHIVYRDYGNGIVKYAFYSDSSWEVTSIDTNGGAQEGTKIAVSSSGQFHLIYSSLPEVLKYATYSSGTWTKETITNMGNPSITLDSSDKPHVAHTYSGGTETEILRYSYREGN